jgi:hypothetical protein
VSAPDDPDDDPRSIAPLGGQAVDTTGEPPVVARMVIEIRSDGSRTIARGAVEDLHTGQRVGIEARGDSPLALALELSRAILSTRRLAGQVVKSLLPWRRPRK